MYFPSDEELKAFFAAVTAASTCASLIAARLAKKAGKTANAAQDTADRALSLCSFPSCGHVCEPGEPSKPNGPARIGDTLTNPGAA